MPEPPSEAVGEALDGAVGEGRPRPGRVTVVGVPPSPSSSSSPAEPSGAWKEAAAATPVGTTIEHGDPAVHGSAGDENGDGVGLLPAYDSAPDSSLPRSW